MDRPPPRPDPQALLVQAQREGRGRLKVFLGAAPGVGKTYAMLEAARARKREGLDVVAGVIETHGRADTIAQIGDLEILPRRRMAHRDKTIEEFDLDAALARRPALLLIDELAHSNAPGSRHPKRYLDVLELLDRGIDVWTTLNVQHLDSLNDIVAKVTRVRVQETLPDSALERADEVELIDLTPDDLIARLKQGKIYAGATAVRAAENFFKPGNLTALRELALRRTAERVDDQMVGLMARQAIPGPWPAGERILACVSADPAPEPIVRAARRLADQIGAKWMAVHFEAPRQYSTGDAARVAEALRLAERLGGEARTVPTSDVIADILALASANNITQIIVGKTRRPRWTELFGRSLVYELMRTSDAVAIHVVPSDAASQAARVFSTLRSRLAARIAKGPRPFIEATAAVAAATGALLLIGRGYDTANSETILLLTAVIYTATRFGLTPSLYASVLSVLVFDFLFVAPFYTLTIGDPRDVLALGVFVAVSLVLSNLASRVREQAHEARKRFRTTAALYDFSRKLAGAAGIDDLVWVIAHQVATMMGVGAVLLVDKDGRLIVRGGYPPEDDLPPGDWAAANWAHDHGEPAGKGSDTLPSAERLYVPLRDASGIVGVLGVRPPEGKKLDPEARRLLDALVDQSAVALARLRLDDEIRDARVLAESEKLRGALLSSISHDLTTPLATITGAASTLRRDHDRIDGDARRQLFAAIQDEADRLTRFVRNLLDMTRLESGALTLRREWIDPREIVGAAIARVRQRAPSREIALDETGDPAPIRVDATLIGQALHNLIDNAVKYSAGAVRVKIATERERLVVTIDDDGPGVPPADLVRVFDKFFRVRPPGNPRWGDRQSAGTGLGLPIAQGFVEAHGGTVRLVSPIAGDRGTRAIVEIPLATEG